jgi:hypothetical protein
VDLPALERLHPAWPERDSLTALIASAHISHQRPISPFRVPPEPSLPPVPQELGATSPAEQARMERLIEDRIQRDFDAVREKVDREVARFQETEEAAAENQARLDAEASAQKFRQQYLATAVEYADRIAPLELEVISLRPQPADRLMMPRPDRQNRAQRLAAVQFQINALLGAREKELRALQQGYAAGVQAVRQRLLAEAAARVTAYRQARLAELQQTRTRQDEEIEADLERSMRLRVDLPAVVPPQPGPTAAAARRLAAGTSASALVTMDRYHEAARDVEHELYVQRAQVEELILESTRAAVLQLAREHRIDVRFAPSTAGPDLTQLFAAWLRDRWARSSA